MKLLLSVTPQDVNLNACLCQNCNCTSHVFLANLRSSRQKKSRVARENGCVFCDNRSKSSEDLKGDVLGGLDVNDTINREDVDLAEHQSCSS